MQETKTHYGIVGLGIIGSRVLAHAKKAALSVSGWNRTPKPEYAPVEPLEALAERCTVIQLFVSDAPAVEAVLKTLLPHLTPAHLIVCSATIGKPATLAIAKTVADIGATFLDCPFTGSKGAADAGQLVYYASGTDEAIERARPLLAAAARAILPMGPIGEAAMVKVVTNLIGAAQVQILAEALTLLQREGIDGTRLVEALELHATRSVIADMKLPKMLTDDFTPHFSVKHMLKDVRMGVQSADQQQVEAPISRVVETALAHASLEMAELDFSALFRVASRPSILNQ